MPSIRDRIALITGASSGIGRATAEAFAAEGVHLLLCARRADRLEQLAADLASRHGIRVHAFSLDVQDRPAVQSTLAALPAEWAAIDILVNNAGLSRGLARLHEDDPQNWDEMIATNIGGLLSVTRAVVPGMVARAAATSSISVRPPVTSPTPTAPSTAPPKPPKNPSPKASSSTSWEAPSASRPSTPAWSKPSSAKSAFAATPPEPQRSTKHHAAPARRHR